MLGKRKVGRSELTRRVERQREFSISQSVLGSSRSQVFSVCKRGAPHALTPCPLWGLVAGFCITG